MKLDIYTEKRIPVTTEDIREALEIYDWDTAVKKFFFPLGKAEYGGGLDDDFVEALTRQILPKMKSLLKYRGADKKYLDACNVLIDMFKENDF